MGTKRQISMAYKFLISLMSIVFMFTGLGLAYDLKEYYPLGQGNSWIHSVIRGKENYQETVRIEGTEIIEGIETVKMVLVGNGYECMTVDSEGIKMYKDLYGDEYVIFNPARIIFPNIEIGGSKKYSINYTTYYIKTIETEEGNRNDEIRLESIEDITVPAGRFNDCLKFSLISDWRETDGDYGRDDCNIWLAPGVGKVKEFCFYTEYDAEDKKEITYMELYELISAIVDGKKIGSQ